MADAVSDIIAKINPKLGPLAEHKLVYDSSSETLEPVYFFILDLMGDFGFKLEKLIDNFTSSPGSGHFAELGQRATIMQQQGTKLLGDINTVLRSVLNIIYDLKDFRLRLQSYDELKGDKKEAAMLSLKQIWMDKVDITKQNSSIKALSLGQAGFQTLIHAFLAVKDEKDVEKIDLNDSVKRILLSRIVEFNHWLIESEKELSKRYELEKTYLKSQVNALKLYSRWAKPYLKAAQELEMKEQGREPALVKAFNTMILELTLMGKRKVNVQGAAREGKISKDFEKLKGIKDYYTCVLVSFRFRGIPQRAGQQPHYLFGGRAEVTFKAYALNEDEIAKIDEELNKSDLGEALKLIEGTTTESLDHLQKEIDFFLEEENIEKKAEEKKKESGDSSNPFKALLGGYEKSNEKPKEEPKKDEKPKVVLRPESWAEKEYVRPLAAGDAKETAFKLFDIYKKAHGMASYT